MLQLNFTPFPDLLTERLLLRKTTISDADDIFFLRSDKSILKYLGKSPAKTVDEAIDFIKMINQSIDSNESILWAITVKESPKKVIGTICYWRILKEHFRAEIGYVLHPEYWGKGIMKEALLKVLEYGFNEMKLHSIEARLDEKNIASEAILKATGFTKEGFLKEDFFFEGSFSNTVIYSRLQQ